MMRGDIGIDIAWCFPNIGFGVWCVFDQEEHEVWLHLGFVNVVIYF